MVDEATNLIMEQLHLLRRGQEDLQLTIETFQQDTHAAIADLKARMTAVENAVGPMGVQYAQMQQQVLMQNGRLDRIETAIGHIGTRLGNVEHRLDNIEHRLDTVERRLDAMDHRFERIESRLDRIERRLDLHPA
jgi:chromosome segregation ATPase